MSLRNIFIKFRNISNFIYGVIGFILGIILLFVQEYLLGIICMAIGAFLIYRNYKKLKIKADLGLMDHSAFFSECNYNGGVKSDDYVDLIVLSQDPMPTLDVQCNRIASDSEWSQCGVANSGTGVLAHCGVSKCTTSKKCDFEVDVSGLNTAYLVFRTGDAWMADIEGILSNLQVCK